MTRDLLSIVTEDVSRRFNVCPIKLNGNSLQLAVSETFNIDDYDTLEFFLGIKIEGIVLKNEEVEKMIDRFYLSRNCGKHEEFRVSEGSEALEQFIQKIINEGIYQRASDIHFEPMSDGFRVRYRVDGVLKIVEKMQKIMHLSMVAYLKLLAHISLDQKRLPQDGRIGWVCEGREYNLRVSTLPSIYGEAIVLRILDREELNLEIENLGFLKEQLVQVRNLLKEKNGVILVTGPTGSGKTTTLYSFLKARKIGSEKIITIENPVEYQLPGVNQIPIQEQYGPTFAEVLRSVLRQSPDVIMIGEIRDMETAKTVFQAGLTGHLIFSTLHTNDAMASIERLKDLGVSGQTIAAGLRGIISQRLISKKEGKGRIGFFEVLVIDDELRKVLVEVDVG